MLEVIIPSLMCSFGWGISPIFDKKALFYLPPIISVAILGIFFGIFGVILLSLLYYWKPEILKKNTKDLPIGIWYLFLAAFLSYVGGYIFFFLALGSSNTANIVILVAYTLPIIIGILATVYMLNEKINPIMWIGIILTLLGLVITVKYKNT